ncbi:MAG: endonuclease III [Bacillota bacterium]
MSICRPKEKEKKRATEILGLLAEQYPDAVSGLVHRSPYQLFVATVLSAQTTDEQVNKITKDFFEAVPTVHDLARMKPAELEPYLKRVGLYRHKSRYLIEAARVIVEEYGGRIPDKLDQLIKLPGVGRKTANIIISSAYGRPALAVDTHVFRVSRRLGLANGKRVDTVEGQLKRIIPQDQWISSHHRLIAHGRQRCKAKKPECSRCFLKQLCPYGNEKGEK